MTLLHLVVSFFGLAIKGWHESLLVRFRMVGVGGMVAVLTLHLDFEHFHSGGEGGNWWPLIALVLAFGLMVAAHNFPSHKTHHVNCCEGDAHPFVSYWWVAALLVHSMTDGYLLGISETFSESVRDSIWAFLVVHKVLEAIWVSSLMALEFKKSTLAALICIYVLTFPLGFAIPALIESQGYFSAESLSFVFGILGALSMGSLLACVVMDQLIPSIKNIRKDFKQVLWFVAGFALTHGVLFLTHGNHAHVHEPAEIHEHHDHEVHDH